MIEYTLNGHNIKQQICIKLNMAVLRAIVNLGFIRNIPTPYISRFSIKWTNEVLYIIKCHLEKKEWGLSYNVYSTAFFFISVLLHWLYNIYSFLVSFTSITIITADRVEFNKTVLFFCHFLSMNNKIFCHPLYAGKENYYKVIY